jgi:hypothetical protein
MQLTLSIIKFVRNCDVKFMSILVSYNICVLYWKNRQGSVLKSLPVSYKTPVDADWCVNAVAKGTYQIMISASYISCIYSNRIQDIEVRSTLPFVNDVLFTNFPSKTVIRLMLCHQLNATAQELFINKYCVFVFGILKRQYILRINSAESIQIPLFDCCHVLFVYTPFSSPSVAPNLAHVFSETLKPSLSSQIVPTVSPDSSRDTRGRTLNGTVWLRE